MAARIQVSRARSRFLLAVHAGLRSACGELGWWPAETKFEICVGALLTQNTAWTNVERTLGQLRARGLLSFAALDRLSALQLAPLLRSAGTFNVKARRLRALLDFLGSHFDGRVERMAAEPADALRAKLLCVKGVGPETADAIALYAAGAPLFVVDAYTRRLFTRLGLLSGRESYAQIQALFHAHLPRDARLFADYHALIVEHAKAVCRKRPRCGECVLRRRCAFARNPREPRKRSGRDSAGVLG
ncbi:MAG: endonuclease III domain-containing protein [Vicinamibacteria bacterium]